MTLYQWLSVFGLCGIPMAAIGFLFKQLRTMRKTNADDNKAIRLGIQALLRAQLITEWNYHSEKGYAPIYARENFENVYQQYHNLGANGVMDDIHTKFFALPDKPKKGESK